jgi:hypothetical protein
MAVLYRITQGWTEEIGPFLLTKDGQPFDLSGFTIKMFCRPKKSRDMIEAAGQVRQAADQAGAGKGQVFYLPTGADFQWRASPYIVHFMVTDQGGKSKYFPNGEGDEILVSQP